MIDISKSQTSHLAELDKRVYAFLDRPTQDKWPYLWIDTTYAKAREAGRIISVAVIITVAMNTDDVLEIFSMRVGPSETEPFWTDFLRSLMCRGLCGVKLVISGTHEGLKAVVAKVLRSIGQRLPGALHMQRLGSHR